MAESTSPIQFISDAEGKTVGVIVPIDLWREIESERETAYLLRSESMKRRLLEAKERQGASPWRTPVRGLEFDPSAFEDLSWWCQ